MLLLLLLPGLAGLRVHEEALLWLGVLKCLAWPWWRFSREVVSCLVVAVLVFAPLCFPLLNPDWYFIQSGSLSFTCRFVFESVFLRVSLVGGVPGLFSVLDSWC